MPTINLKSPKVFSIFAFQGIRGANFTAVNLLEPLIFDQRSEEVSLEQYFQYIEYPQNLIRIY